MQSDTTFIGLVTARQSSFKRLVDIDKKGNKVHEYVPDVTQLIKGTSGIDGQNGAQILDYFVKNEKFSGDMKLNNYSFFCTAGGLASKLNAEYEYKGGVIVRVIKPLEVMTLQMLRDVVKKIGKHLEVRTTVDFKPFVSPKLGIHDSRVETKFKPVKKSPSVNLFTDMK